jgi:hypothetical protein
VSIASVFFTFAVAGFGLLLVWRVRRFLGVSVPNKSRKIQLSKIFFFAPWPKSHNYFQALPKMALQNLTKSPPAPPHIRLKITETYVFLLNNLKNIAMKPIYPL